jgi:hypothetical protein
MTPAELFMRPLPYMPHDVGDLCYKVKGSANSHQRVGSITAMVAPARLNVNVAPANSPPPSLRRPMRVINGLHTGKQALIRAKASTCLGAPSAEADALTAAAAFAAANGAQRCIRSQQQPSGRSFRRGGTAATAALSCSSPQIWRPQGCLARPSALRPTPQPPWPASI